MTTEVLPQSGVGAIAPSTHPAFTHDHSLTITLVEETLKFAFECTAEVSAPCRVLCGSGCESWGVDHLETTGHVMTPYRRCLFVEWMDATSQNSFYLDELAMTSDARVLFEGPIEIEYSDGYTWRFVDETKESDS